MKKLIILFAMQYVCTVNAQWLNKTVDNNFDPIYKVSSNKVYNEADLRMQNVDNLLKVYLAGEFWCTDNPIVELSFLVRGHREYYSITGIVIGDFKNVLIITVDLEAENFFQDFKYCGELKIIVQQKDCPNEYYEYNMEGTQRAIKYLKTEL
jgi:hypothetical protein